MSLITSAATATHIGSTTAAATDSDSALNGAPKQVSASCLTSDESLTYAGSRFKRDSSRRLLRRSLRPAELGAVLPQFTRLEYAGGRDDAGDELRRRDIEARIPRAARRVRHAHVGAFTGL